MGVAPARMTAAGALDAFFQAYYRRRPVTATFTGVHAFDRELPDWSPDGLSAAVAEMRDLRRTLREGGLVPDAQVTAFPEPVDLALADGFLEMQIAEHEGDHFYRSNPALWSGEAIFSVLALVTRDFAPLPERLESAAARMRAIPQFLADAQSTLVAAPTPWKEKAIRECDAAAILFGRSLPAWAPPALAEPIEAARQAFDQFRAWLARDLATARPGAEACGGELLQLLLRRGHWCETPINTLLDEARSALDEAQAQLAVRVREAGCGSWPEAQVQLGALHPSAADYYPRFTRVWQRCYDAVRAADLVTWPDRPIRYVPIPAHTREAAPLLYYLFYRSPAPFDRLPTHDYVVTPIDGVPQDELDRRLAAASDSTILLNHVVHHGGLGHHVQNAHAYASRSRIGQVAAVDAASRIAMFCGGTVAEGWACYACDLAEDVGLLTPLERAAQQHTRVRLAARAVADLSLHTGDATLEDTARLYETRGLMAPGPARAEAVKNAMFPGAAVMYWLGTRDIHRLRAAVSRREGGGFSLKRFHDTFLSHGAIPVRLIARLMLLVLVAAVAACTRTPAGPAPSNDLLIVGYDREPDTLNRFSTHILEDIQTCVIEGLTITDHQMNIVPLLAAEVPTPENGGVVVRSDGGMDVTWRLRPGVTWHDGTALTSADVKFTVDAINDPSYNPESTDGFDRIASVDTPDPLTAIVHYKEVYAPYALQFVRGLFPKHVLEGRDIDRAADYNRAPLGTGPYRVAEWKSGEYIRLERVPNYWRGSQYPHIKEILFRFVANTNTRINQLKSGEVHLVAMFPWDKHREVQAIPGVTVHRTAGNAYEHVTLNQRRVAAFRDVRVRQALLHAIDRDTLVSTILDGLAPVTHGAIQPVSWAFTKDVTTYPFDVDRARALLEDAGWRDANGDGVREQGTQPLRFTLITQAGFGVREAVAQVLQRQFRDVGVDMSVQLVDGTSISGLWFEGNFDAMLHWWQMPADPELTLFFAADRMPPHGRNINYFEDAEVTALTYAADRTVNQAERTRLLAQAQQRIAALLPELPLYSITKLDAVPAGLHGFTGNPTNTGVFWNVHAWEFR